MRKQFWHFIARHFGWESRAGRYKLLIFDGLACITRREEWARGFTPHVIIWEMEFE